MTVSDMQEMTFKAQRLAPTIIAGLDKHMQSNKMEVD